MRIAQLLAASAAAAALAATASSVHAQSLDTAGSAFTWTGAYVGLNVGDNYDAATRFDRTTGALPNNTTALTLGLRPVQHAVHTNGFTGGAQVGYNYQLGDRYGLGALGLGGGGHGGIVVGVETDVAFSDTRKSDTLSNTTNFGPLDTLGATPNTRVNQYQGNLNYLGTVRGRVGYAYDHVLVYGTGGLAYGAVDRRATFFGPNTPGTPFFTSDGSGTRAGVAYGGGIEFALPTGGIFDRFNFAHVSAVTIKAEYLRYDLGADTFTMPGVNGGATIGSYTARVRTDGDLVRGGINYKF